MKLNNRHTILVGLAFLSICAFWQMYDSVIPLILTKTFHISETISGAVMAADNVFALFLLPVFGALSDKTDTRLGKRTPYILGGTVAAVVLLNILPFIDNGYYASPSMQKLVLFVVLLGLLLIAMGSYRSPAVALMPDVTPKPLRSKANAIINLMGALGGILYLIVAALLYPNSKVVGTEHVNYRPLFVVVSLIMAVSVIILFATIREKELVRKNQELEDEHPDWNHTKHDASGKDVLPDDVKRSFGFLMASIALWFIGYNGITTWFTTYVDQVMGQGLGGASTCLLIASAGAIVSYIPIGALSSRIGRKKTIMLGIVVLALCFLSGFFLTTLSHSLNIAMFIVFAFTGFAWAAINVNSFPMVVEICKGADIGKFTGYYYTASMAAQVATPILAGFLMRNIDYRILFPYATLFAGASFFTMIGVKHGDCVVEAKKGLDAYEEM